MREPLSLLQNAGQVLSDSVSIIHERERCENGWTNQHAVWGVDSWGPRNHELHGLDSTQGNGYFWQSHLDLLAVDMLNLIR